VGARARESESDADRDEALLYAVVEVAFDPAPFGVAGDDDPRPRLPKLMQHVVPSRVELGVLRRQQRDGARGAQELGSSASWAS
jgi:hypothetical protein